MSDWTDEKKAAVIKEYQDQKPTPENTMDIVADLAQAHNVTVNGVRQILAKANVYVAKGKATTAADTEAKPKRKSKQESLDDLDKILTDNGVEVDSSITSKLTGKAAEYFIEAFKTILKTD
jgi:HEAT repeat protein